MVSRALTQVGRPRDHAGASVVLASRSPQRSAILAQLGVEFIAMNPEIDELREGDPSEVVLENARRKARAGHAFAPGALVLGCDTEVVLEGRVLGKPRSREEALSDLRALAGREHEVLSGLALVEPGGAEGEMVERSGVSRSIVRFRALDDATIARYLDTDEWRDRAGGYAIQGLGAALVESVEGDISNVIGLPVGLLWELAPELL